MTVELDLSARELIRWATRARENAYAPYSKVKIGAALLTNDGAIITGSNVENASYSLAMCAERVAVFNAVSNGHRGMRTLAIVTDAEEPVAPCGACREVIREFGKNARIFSATLKGAVKTWKVEDLLPDRSIPGQHDPVED